MDIRFEGIRIRNASSADCQQLADWWNDGAVMAHAGFPNGIGTTPEEIRRQIARERDETGRTLIIEYRARSIGEMNYRRNGECHKVIFAGNRAFRQKYLSRSERASIASALNGAPPFPFRAQRSGSERRKKN